MTGKSLAIVLGCIVAATALAGIGDNAAASGDHNHHTYGEDEGYYDENNNNPFDDDCFPGQSSQNRSGVQW